MPGFPAMRRPWGRRRTVWPRSSLFRPRKGQPVESPFKSDRVRREAAASIFLGGGCGCFVVSIYGFRCPTATQRAELNQTVKEVLCEFRSGGRRRFHC